LPDSWIANNNSAARLVAGRVFALRPYGALSFRNYSLLMSAIPRRQYKLLNRVIRWITSWTKEPGRTNGKSRARNCFAENRGES